VHSSVAPGGGRLLQRKFVVRERDELLQNGRARNRELEWAKLSSGKKDGRRAGREISWLKTADLIFRPTPFDG
jgi:hypothetical protein